MREIYLNPTIEAQLRWLQGPTDTVECGSRTQLIRKMRGDAKLWDATAALLKERKSVIQATSLSEARHIFITGCTGFLGAFVLAELSRKSAARLHCLVRSPQGSANGGSELGVQRILDNLAAYALSVEPAAIVAHSGDLTQKHLGLAESEFYDLTKKVDLVFHCGALVNYLYPYDVMKGPAVDGTQEILSLAVQAGAALHYISTNGIFGSDEARPVFKEDRNIDGFAEFLDNGYGQAKWVAEKIVWQAMANGLPVCIYRPGNLGHSQKTGRYNPNDFQTLILQAVLGLRCAPIREEESPWSFEFTPVDFLAETLADFAEMDLYGQVFNVVEREPLPASILFELLEREGWVDILLPYAEWLERLRSKARQTGDKALLVLCEGLHDVELWLDDKSIYDDSRLRKLRTRPQVDREYYRQLIESLRS
ncbi:MAG: thioester reductase domain-containing protein [Spirochaetota bacterium]